MHGRVSKTAKGTGSHWFLDEVFKWRSIASAVWTWCMAFPVMAIFIALFSLHPRRHIYVVYDFVNTISEIKTWFICIVVATLTGLMIHLHFRYYEVAPVSPVTRLGFVARVMKPASLARNAVCGAFCVTVAHFATQLVRGPYSFTYHQCDFNTADGTINELCLNETWFIMVLFGLVLGVFHSMYTVAQQKNTLCFLKVQEARFLCIKCKLPAIILTCASKSFSTLRHFFIGYYLFGFIARDAAAFIMGVLPSEYHLISFWRVFHAIPVLWNLWLLGTLLSLLLELSWELFNIYNTQNFPFLLDSVFPEDQPKLLVENLCESAPPMVQHLAYQCLSLIAKQDPIKRQQIFALSHQTENGRPIWWNKVADCCLFRIGQLTDQLGECQLLLSACADGQNQRWRNKSSTSSSASDDSRSGISPRSLSALRRRPIAGFESAPSADKTNLSYFNVSSLNTTNVHASAHATQLSHNISVPTPRLWTSTAGGVEGGDFSGSPSGLADAPLHARKKKRRFDNFVTNIKSLPIIAYFLSLIPSWVLQNLYRERLIHVWAMQSLSYLCSASIAEDKFGVVQTRLHEVIAALVDLLGALEKLGKASGSSTHTHRLYSSLCNETKSSLHRIADAYGDSLKSVNLSQEHRRRLHSLMSYTE